MRKILTLTMSGLVTVLPLALTIYVIWWLVQTVEGWLRRALIALGIVSPEHYWPGLGLVAGFALLLVIGSLVNAYAGKILLKYWDDFLGRIPFVKTLYGGFRDVVSLLPSGSGEKRDLQRVVLARFADVHAIGFVTREDVPSVLLAHGGQDWVTVYFPMSYAFGGYTIYLPRERIEPLDISVEDAMRLAITAGLTALRLRQAPPARRRPLWQRPAQPRPDPMLMPQRPNTRSRELTPPRFSVLALTRIHWRRRRRCATRARDTAKRRSASTLNPPRWSWQIAPASWLRKTRASAGCICNCARARPPATSATSQRSCAGWTRTMARPGCKRWARRRRTGTRWRWTGFSRTWPARPASISTGTASWC